MTGRHEWKNYHIMIMEKIHFFIITGKGVYTFSNGDRCVGTYVMGKKEGQGTMFYSNG